MHMISEKDLNSADLETVTTWRSPTTVITANGEVQTKEEDTIYVRELGIFLTVKVLEDTPAVLSLGKLCDEHGYSYEWINGQKPHLVKKRYFEYSVIRKISYQSWFLVYQRVLPQACPLQHPWHLQGRKLIIPSLLQARLLHHPWHPQPSQAKVWIGKNGETRSLLKHQKSCWINQPKSPNQVKMRIMSEYGETRVIPTYQNGCKNSERILWMKEFRNTETHTRALLMNYL